MREKIPDRKSPRENPLPASDISGGGKKHAPDHKTESPEIANQILLKCVACMFPEGLPRGARVPLKKIAFLPCSPKIS